MGVLNESDGNGSHAVTIHGGYVYDANEVVGIPLCKEALDYCCSVTMVKNEFVSFRKVTLFFMMAQMLRRSPRWRAYVRNGRETMLPMVKVQGL